MATFNSSSINRGEPARLGIYPTKVCGVVNFVTANKPATNDLINLCKVPQNSFLSNIYISIPILDNGGGPALVMSLQDSLASPTVYISVSTKGTNFSVATNFQFADFVQTTIGTMYGNTARAITTTGPAVVAWTSNINLQLKATTGATNTVGATVQIVYMLEWSPSW